MICYCLGGGEFEERLDSLIETVGSSTTPVAYCLKMNCRVLISA
jgi:hypothetical protein